MQEQKLVIPLSRYDSEPQSRNQNESNLYLVTSPRQTYNIFDFIPWFNHSYNGIRITFCAIQNSSGVYWCKSLRLEIILQPDLSVKEIKSVFSCKAHIHVGQFTQKAVQSWPAGMHTCPLRAGVSVSRSTSDLMIIRIEPQSFQQRVYDKNLGHAVLAWMAEHYDNLL